MHGDARLTPRQRRFLCQRADEEQPTVAEALIAIAIEQAQERADH
jgi:hypothetical protein